jgi:hypothetical protein
LRAVVTDSRLEEHDSRVGLPDYEKGHSAYRRGAGICAYSSSYPSFFGYATHGLIYIRIY